MKLKHAQVDKVKVKSKHEEGRGKRDIFINPSVAMEDVLKYYGKKQE